MTMRKIVKINESKCDGCGLCIPNCAEGALSIIEGKARLVKDIYCDGLGACLGHCPHDAIEITERDAPEFIATPPTGGCPGSKVRQIKRKEDNGLACKIVSKLSQWPVQLKLVPVNAPYFSRADLLITADCVPFAYANYHNDFLKDKAVVVGCPKLDDSAYYLNKLAEIIKQNSLESITVLRMEVPCCGGMSLAAKGARDKAGSDIPVKVVTISCEGEILKREYI